MESMEKLRGIVKKTIGNKQFMLLSYREPYTHYYDKDEVKWRKNPGGLVTALDPVMRVCGGTWIACGANGADMETADEKGCVGVPPGSPAYTLRRAWLTKEEESSYLMGASNSALWPLCHVVYVRPHFNEEEWAVYRQVNERFADMVLEEMKGESAFVWIQDYQLALCAKYIKKKSPESVVAQFWHIPWPSAETFKICPWHREIVEGLLANDLLGFHIRYYAQNFLESVDQSVEARVDREHNSVFFRDLETKVMEFPVGIDAGVVRKASEAISDARIAEVKKRHGIGADRILLGVSRLDYTKGIVEGLSAFQKFLEQNPQYQKKVSFVQITSPSRTYLSEYEEVQDNVLRMSEEINWKYGSGRWKPVVLIDEFTEFEDLVTFYKMADVCIVNSLHDGMNVVAKEYVSANNDGDGMLVLSKFTGAARQLTSALLVNPFSTDEVSAAIKTALEMPEAERKARMKRLLESVTEQDVYAWAGAFIEKLAKIDGK